MLRGFESFFSLKVRTGIIRTSSVAILTFITAVLVAAMPQGVAAQTVVTSTNIGSSTNCTAVPITFSTPGTLTAISVLTQGAPNLDFTKGGSSCAPVITAPTVTRPNATATSQVMIQNMGACALNTAYATYQFCTVYVNFTPRLAGPRYGAVVLTGDSEGNAVLGTRYLQGIGIGPQTTFAVPKEVPVGPVIVPDRAAALVLTTRPGVRPAYTQQMMTVLLPGYQSTIDDGWSIPYGIAVDAAGNVYIADGDDGSVFKETLQSDGSYVSSTIGGEWGIPVGVAVDGAGNVYVADA